MRVGSAGQKNAGIRHEDRHTRPHRRGVSLLTAAVLTMSLVSCGDDRETVDLADARETGTVSALPSTYFLGSSGGFAEVVATDEFVVGLGRPNTQGEDAPLAEAVNLTSGERVGISGPDGVSDLNLTDAVGLTDQVLVQGFRCLEDVGEDERCPSELITYLLDVPDGRWNVVEQPPDLANTTLASTTFVYATQNSILAGFQPADDEAPILFSLRGDGWTRVTELSSDALQSCATSSAVLELASPVGEPPADDAILDDSDMVIEYSMRKYDLESGDVQDLSVPAILREFGGAGVELGCGPQTAYLATSPGENNPGAVFELQSDDTWAEVDNALDPQTVILDSATSGAAAGPAIIAVPFQPNVAEVSTESFTIVFGADGTLKRVAGNTFDSNILWRGLTGHLLILGPYVDEATSGSEVSLRTEEIG